MHGMAAQCTCNMHMHGMAAQCACLAWQHSTSLAAPASAAAHPPLRLLTRHRRAAQAPLLLCYFLVQRDARRLEKLLAKEGLPGVEVRSSSTVAPGKLARHSGSWEAKASAVPGCEVRHGQSLSGS